MTRVHRLKPDWAFLQVLMTDPNSPIIGNYPLNFRIDQEGKRNDWEGVVCIPFIDVQLLLDAARSVNTAACTQIERDRNSHGHILLFRHDKGVCLEGSKS